MVALMTAMPLTEAHVPLSVGALLLVALSTALIVTSLHSPDPTVDWHRSVGAQLMAIVILLHLHVEETAGGHMHHTPTHDTVIERGLQLAVASYLIWTVVTVARMLRRPRARLLRWEHLAMGVSVAVMTFAMH
jgi:hypothetical protein